VTSDILAYKNIFLNLLLTHPFAHAFISEQAENSSNFQSGYERDVISSVNFSN
jgi:hypothetical protein